ncbi:MAG: hypothetical protein Q4G59_11065, partial [Planctomycetia bacterium]|nr:hypothetical protein [Planctomycetia bacterium]
MDRRIFYCFSCIIVAWLFQNFTQSQLQAQEPSWPIDSNGMVNVNSLYSGSGPVVVTLSGKDTTYPQEMVGFILADSMLGGPTLTLQGIWDNNKKPDSSIFNVEFQLDNLSNTAVSKVVFETP